MRFGIVAGIMGWAGAVLVLGSLSVCRPTLAPDHAGTVPRHGRACPMFSDDPECWAVDGGAHE